MTAAVKEIVVRADLVQAEDVSERPAQDFLDCGRRLAAAERTGRVVRGRQRVRSILPFGVNGSSSMGTTTAGTM